MGKLTDEEFNSIAMEAKHHLESVDKLLDDLERKYKAHKLKFLLREAHKCLDTIEAGIDKINKTGSTEK